MTDVLVAGAGPAGTAAAITLARLGYEVTAVDRAVFPRDKCCGDGLTAAALRRVEDLGLEPSCVASWQPVDDVVVVSVSGRRVDLPLGTSKGGLFAVSARRADLDAALVDLARKNGVEVVEGKAVTGVTPAGAGVKVDLEDGSQLGAGYVVAADGMWSPVRKLLGLTPPGYLGEWQAGRQYLGGTGSEARKLWVWFEPDMIPGYAWSFPLPDGSVNFGYGVLKGANPALKGQRIDWRDRPHIAEVLGPDAEPISPWRAWPIPARIGTAPLAALGGRVLFVGDAAGACDPMTGEGIAQALETGEAAARAIAQAGRGRPDLAARRYERVIRWGMALDDRLAQTLSRVLAHPAGSDRALGLVDASDWCRRNFARWMFEDYPRAALATPHRWHRGMFSRPGAYAHRVDPVGRKARSTATVAGYD
ncbi:MAG TPA: NAD(P)/FAD-dependent oxidoreductase [Acidimicrobiales bacterium]|nr:NAD(P)/FAD-dependent oxidoreductase [Acidimicrobiales bacterium]